jgi:hypothetical protein
MKVDIAIFIHWFAGNPNRHFEKVEISCGVSTKGKSASSDALQHFLALIFSIAHQQRLKNVHCSHIAVWNDPSVRSILGSRRSESIGRANKSSNKPNRKSYEKS